MNFKTYLISYTLLTIVNCENLCNCGKFIDLKVNKIDNKYEIDLKAFEEFLSNPLIQGRRLYVIGNYGETDVLSGVILNELYENYKPINSPDCLVHKSKFTSLLDTACTSSLNGTVTIQLWNDIFLYESQNNHKIAIIFINLKARPEQSQYESRIFSAFSGLMSTIYFVLGEESFYNEYYGKESQECDFHFHINELDQRNEIDESILEIHSILSHQNIEMHEDLHFVQENLKISNFLNIFKFGADKITEIEAEKYQKLEEFVKKLKNLTIFDENLMENLNENERKIQQFIKDFKEQAVVAYMNLTSPQLTVPDLTTPKLQRKMKIFTKKLRQIEKIVTVKIQNFITEVTDDFKAILDKKLKNGNDKTILSTKDTQILSFGNVKFGEDVEKFEVTKIVPIESQERIALKNSDKSITSINPQLDNHPQQDQMSSKLHEKFIKIIESKAVKLFDNSEPTEEKIRTKSSRNYIKSLQKLFETANSEIRKSLAFKKLMKQRKISIPFPCDIKC
ncbi:chromosome partition protein Smc-like [Chironomus tepperi]|uniref:chromosome partition protein Smc-like n=1 Tax=Chironomus tepperi TaxID=113505 RepID=UPI00391EE736